MRHVINKSIQLHVKLKTHCHEKSIFTIIVIVLLTSVVPAAKSETQNANHKREVTELLSKKQGANLAESLLKKRKLKKVVRKTGKVYRKIKSDRDSKKKSRKLQRTVRGIINIF